MAGNSFQLQLYNVHSNLIKYDSNETPTFTLLNNLVLGKGARKKIVFLAWQDQEVVDGINLHHSFTQVPAMSQNSG